MRRLAGWVLALNAVGLLGAVALSGSAGEAARGIALLCGVGAA